MYTLCAAPEWFRHSGREVSAYHDGGLRRRRKAMHLAQLRAVRERYPLTQGELAEKAGLTRGTIGALERGTAQARPSTARRLAQALGVAPAELVGGGDVTAADV